MIDVRYMGGLGENLFQYCFGRILAQKFGYAFEPQPIWGFPNTRQSLGGKIYHSPILRWTGVKLRDWATGESIDFNSLAGEPCARVFLNGWFQDCSYFEEFSEEIRGKWLLMDYIEPMRTRGDVAVCMRMGSAVQWERNSRRHLMAYRPPKYSRPSSEQVILKIEEMNARKVTVITDAIHHKVVQEVKENSPCEVEIMSCGPWGDFRLANTFHRIVIANTAYDWWAAFLSRAREIFPMKGDEGPDADQSKGEMRAVSDLPNFCVESARFVECK